jgi:hypothetical protein
MIEEICTCDVCLDQTKTEKWEKFEVRTLLPEDMKRLEMDDSGLPSLLLLFPKYENMCHSCRGKIVKKLRATFIEEVKIIKETKQNLNLGLSNFPPRKG